MAGVDTLVAEVTGDLEHALQSTNHKSLEVELRCDTEAEVRVERIGMGHKRPGDRTPRLRLKNGSLDLHKIERL